MSEKAEAGDQEYNLIYDAFIFQVAKEIGSRATVLFGKVDAIILTGGIAYGKSISKAIRDRVNFIAPVVVYPGEEELRGLLNEYRTIKENGVCNKSNSWRT